MRDFVSEPASYWRWKGSHLLCIWWRSFWKHNWIDSIHIWGPTSFYVWSVLWCMLRAFRYCCLFTVNIFWNVLSAIHLYISTNDRLVQCIWMGFISLYPPANFVCRGYTVFTLSVRASVRASVRNALFP